MTAGTVSGLQVRRGKTLTLQFFFQCSCIKELHRTHPFVAVDTVMLVYVDDVEQMVRHLSGVSCRLTIVREEFVLVQTFVWMPFLEFLAPR